MPTSGTVHRIGKLMLGYVWCTEISSSEYLIPSTLLCTFKDINGTSLTMRSSIHSLCIFRSNVVGHILISNEPTANLAAVMTENNYGLPNIALTESFQVPVYAFLNQV